MLGKDHDSVDVGLGEYVQRGNTPAWLAAYRLLSKSTPGLPEVAIRMQQLSEFERSYSHVLLYPPQPAAMVTLEGRNANFSTKRYGFYLQEQWRLASRGGDIKVSFLVWHRFGRDDAETGCVENRGGSIVALGRRRWWLPVGIGTS